jgi:hypothetical protein
MEASAARHAEEATMRALVVYASMYGNTQAIAEAITDGFSGGQIIGGADRARTRQPRVWCNRRYEVTLLGRHRYRWLRCEDRRFTSKTASRRQSQDESGPPRSHRTGVSTTPRVALTSWLSRPDRMINHADPRAGAQTVADKPAAGGSPFSAVSSPPRRTACTNHRQSDRGNATLNAGQAGLRAGHGRCRPPPQPRSRR